MWRVQPGNQTAALFSAPDLFRVLESLPADRRPRVIRGDMAFGVEPIMARAEGENQGYLFKLRLTKNVKVLIEKLFNEPQWQAA